MTSRYDEIGLPESAVCRLELPGGHARRLADLRFDAVVFDRRTPTIVTAEGPFLVFRPLPGATPSRTADAGPPEGRRVLAFRDDGRLVAADRSGFSVWDGTRCAVRHAWPSDVTAVALSPDGTRVAACAARLRVHDVVSGATLVDAPLARPTTNEGVLCLGNHGRFAAFAVVRPPSAPREATTAPASDAANGWELVDLERRETRFVPIAALHHIAMSPDEQLVVTSDAGCAIRAWRLPSLEPAWVNDERSAPVDGLAFSDDASLLGATTRARWFRVLRAADGVGVGPDSVYPEPEIGRSHVIRSPGSSGALRSPAWSPDRSTVAFLSTEPGHGVSVWEPRAGARDGGPDAPRCLLEGAPSAVRPVKLLSRGEIAAVVRARTLSIHDAHTGALQWSTEAEGFALDAAGETVYVAAPPDAGHAIDARDARTGAITAELLEGRKLRAVLARFEDGSWLTRDERGASAVEDDAGRRFAIDDAWAHAVPMDGHDHVVVRVDSTRGRTPDLIRVRDLRTGALVAEARVEHLRCPPALVGAGPRMLLQSDAGNLCEWQPGMKRVSSRTRVHVMGLLVSLAVSPDGNVFAAGGHHAFIVVGAMKGKTVTRELRGHRGAVTALDLSPDARRLLSGGDDGNAYVWAL
ncbi:MAG: PD40 domain-containing protein [Deltaproteobacteria bacterium]|nr:PD40 domain-containing protein [Deltaproteobacteria bacterium]